MQTAIQLQNVSKHYRIGGSVQRVLKGVSIEIAKGEFMSIIGPSGSGKTTLAHIIGGLTKPTHGDVLVDGDNLRRSTDKQLSRYRNQQVGFVFQSFSLLPHYTALENVAVPLALARVGWRKRRQMAEEALQAVDLGRRLKSYTHQLSGGERQRVAIARALVRQPDIIIADEPTGSLDTKQGDEIAGLLQRLQRDFGATLVMVTHNPELAARADRTLHLLDGVVEGVRSAAA